MNLWPPGVGLARLEDVDSTNAEARRRAMAGERGPLWIAAAHQSAGRGRRGRSWETGKGNLAATLLMPLRVPPVQAAQLSFVAALAVAETVLHFAPHAAVTLKWPNDILADHQKLAGILLEAGDGWLAIDVGLNLAHHPESVMFPAASLSALGVSVPAPVSALTILAARFSAWLEIWEQEGFVPVRTAWLARAEGLGLPIRVRLPQEERHGTFEDIDAAGALLLREPNGLRAVTAGEVFF